MTAPDVHTLSRRDLRAARRRRRAPSDEVRARHARRHEGGRGALAAFAAAVVVAAGATAAVGGGLAASAPPMPVSAAPAAPSPSDAPREPLQVRVESLPPEGLPTPSLTPAAVSAGTVCEQPAVVAALAAGDDGALIAAFGGGEPFRATVAAGLAPCVRLDDPARTWTVVNKLRPYAPADWAPPELAIPEGVRTLDEVALRPEAAGALTALVRAAAEAGAGEIAVESAYRSHATQQQTYDGHVADRGVAGADLVSARPGFSEHQSGLTADVVPCDGACRSIDDLAASAQGAWIAAHAAEYGWIVRYAEGRTDVTGYASEPWHLRYIGTELARAYAAGGWTTLEEFFALPPAPDYAG